MECGALDGETGSNTLYFEKQRKWSGLLIEADPDNFRALTSKHRKSFSINACLSTNAYPSRVRIVLIHGSQMIKSFPTSSFLSLQTSSLQTFKVAIRQNHGCFVALNYGLHGLLLNVTQRPSRQLKDVLVNND